MESLLVGASDVLERRYLGLVSLTRRVSEALEWKQLAEAVSFGLEEAVADLPCGPPGIRIWAITPEGIDELVRFPAEHEFGRLSARALRRAAGCAEPLPVHDGGLLMGLHAGGVSLGAMEIDDPTADLELLAHAAPVVACKVSLLARQGVGDVLLAPFSPEAGSDAAALMATFASEAKRQLDHDRLSAYLLACDGRAFERFCVATSSIIPGEGVIIPFEDVGLRHIVISDRALVSADLASDPRIVGREDRVIAQAGFHGLLSVPLRLRGRPIGVLNFVSRTPGFYGEQDTPIAQQIADQIAAFVGNLSIQERMRSVIRHEAAEHERTRVARDLYHAMAQTVPAIERLGCALSERLAESDPAASLQGDHVRDLAHQTLTQVRRAVADMVPRELDAHTLEEAIGYTLTRLDDDEPSTTLEVIGDTRGLSGAVRRGVFRIFQEALTNIRQHAAAGTIRVTLKCDRDLVLTVEDDGVGFVAESSESGNGLGLRFMSERTRALGATLTIDSEPRRGTAVRFALLGARDAAEERTPPERGSPLELPQAACVRVLVVERHDLIRAGLVRIIETSPGLRVVGVGATAEQARVQAARLHPDVALVAAQLAHESVDALIRELHAASPATRLVVMTDGQPGRNRALEARGASAVLHKLLDEAELTDALGRVARGAPVGAGEPAATDGERPLSGRELSILALVATGQTNAEIGSSLFLATKTVERQVSTIVQKLGARNRAHAAAIAVARDLIEPP